MYAYISGNIVSVKTTGIIIDNGGIGYEIFTPDPYIYKRGETCLVHTFHYVKEDAQELFGFENEDALEFFKKIITVKGIGPKTGLSILSKAKSIQIIEAIENSDIKFLRTLPGVGPKMASQMVLDLQGKLVMGSSEEKSTNSQVLDDVLDTLVALGFKRNELNSVKSIIEKSDSQDVDVLLRLALQHLAK